MDKIKEFIKDKKLYIASFVIITFVFLFLCIILKITPFGYNNLLYSDLNAQEYPMLLDFKNTVMSGELNYSWHGGFGAPYYRVFFNYMSSPLNILALLFSNENMVNFVTLLFYLKFILMAFAITFYLRKKLKSNDIILLIPILLYTFSGYSLKMIFNIKWTDMLIFLPILTYSIELLVDKHKIYPYIITLVLIMFDNYYMGYMMCVYTAIYFIVYNLFFTEGKSTMNKINNMSKNFLIILGSTITFILLSAFFLLPNYYASTTFSAVGGGFPKGLIYKYTYLDMFINHLPYTVFSINYNLKGNPPLLYAGLLSFLTIIPFIFNKNIKLKEKAFYLLLIIIFILILRIPILDFIINAFHIPNGIPYRYSFIYIFFLIIILSKQLLNIDKKWLILIPTIIIELVLGYILLFNKDYYLLTSDFIICNMLLLLLFTIIYIIYNKKTKYLLILFVIIECGLSLFFQMSTITTLRGDLYLNDDNKLYNEYDDYKYKIEYNTYDGVYGLNYKSYKYQYNSISQFTSNIYGDLCILNNKLGVFSDSKTNLTYTYNTPVFNSIMNIKYLYGFSENTTDLYYEKSNDVDTYKYPMSLVFGVNNNDGVTLDSTDYYYNQVQIAKNMSGVDGVLELANYKKKLIYEDDEYIVYNYILYSNDNYFYHYGNYLFMTDDNYFYSYPKFNYEVKEKLGVQNKKERPLGYLLHISHTNDKKISVVYQKGIDEGKLVIQDYIFNQSRAVRETITELVRSTEFPEKPLFKKLNPDECGLAADGCEGVVPLFKNAGLAPKPPDEKIDPLCAAVATVLSIPVAITVIEAVS